MLKNLGVAKKATCILAKSDDVWSQRLVPKTCPKDLSQRLVPKTCPIDLSQRLVPKTCPKDFTTISFVFHIRYACNFNGTHGILTHFTIKWEVLVTRLVLPLKSGCIKANASTFVIWPSCFPIRIGVNSVAL